MKFDAAEPRPIERHDAALLALLVLEGPQCRARLAGLLWPDAKPDGGLNNLRQRIHRMRRLGRELIEANQTTVQIATDVIHDLTPDSVLAQPGIDSELLGTLHFAPGEPLSEQVEILRERWAAMRLEVLESASEQAEQEHRFDAALRYADRALRLRPLSEYAYRRCMRLHYLRGDRAQALVVFSNCRDQLRLKLNVEPVSETQQLAQLLESGALSGRDTSWSTPRVALARPPRLVGRQREWSLLQSICKTAMVVVVRGEAGIGKSRLASEFAQSRGPALIVKAHADERASPWAMAARLARALHGQKWLPPTWESPRDGSLEIRTSTAQPWEFDHLARLALLKAIDAWSQRRNVTMMIDDTQWADLASLDLLLNWLDRVPEGHPPVLFCIRDNQIPRELDRWISSRAPGTVLDIKLGALDETGVSDLVDSLKLPSIPSSALTTATTSLFRQTGGHPFILLELLRSHPDVWSYPPTSSWQLSPEERCIALLQQRTARLPPDAQRLAAVWALAGASGSRQLAADIMDLPDDMLSEAWRQLVEAQMVQVDGMMFDLVAKSVLQSLPATVEMAWHRRIAASMVARHSRDDVIALHWEAGGCWTEAAKSFERAARIAAKQGRRTEELAFWDKVARCSEQANDKMGGLAARITALSAAIVVDGSLLLSKRIAELEACADRPEDRLAVLTMKGRALINAGEAAAAIAPAQEAEQLALAIGDAAGYLRAVGWRALALALENRVQESLMLFSAHSEHARAVQARAERMDFFGSWGYALFLSGAYAQAMEVMGTAASLAEELGELGEAMEQVCNLSTCLNALGRHDESLAEGERALNLWRRHGEPKSVSAAMIQTQLAGVYTGSGNFQVAIELLNHAVKCFQDMGPPNLQTNAEHRLATVFLRLGQPARARACLSPLPPACDVGRQVFRTMIECRVADALGEPVLEKLEATRRLHESKLIAMDRRALLLLLVAHLPAEASRNLAQAVLEDALAAGDAPATLHARVRLAEASRLLGEARAAADEAREAWSMGANAPVLDLDRPAINWLIYRAASAGGDDETAMGALLSGAEWIAKARASIPAAYQRSFCERNFACRNILLEAGNRGWTLGPAGVVPE